MNALKIIFALALLSFSQSCTRSSGSPIIKKNTQNIVPAFIGKVQANRMIQSYLTSVGFPNQDLHIRSLVYNADSLRAYLSNPTIKHVRLMFAHNMNYILAGKEGQPPLPGDIAMTVVIAGVDSTNHYVYHSMQDVMDNGMPCPDNCQLANQSPVLD